MDLLSVRANRPNDPIDQALASCHDRIFARTLQDDVCNKYSDTIVAIYGRTIFDRTKFSSVDSATFVVECVGSEHRVFCEATADFLLDLDAWIENLSFKFNRAIFPLGTWLSRYSRSLEFGVIVAVSSGELWRSGDCDPECVGVFQGDLLESICDFVEQHEPAYLLVPNGVMSFDVESDEPPF